MKDGSNRIIDFLFGGGKRELIQYVLVYILKKKTECIHTLSKNKTFMLLRVQLIFNIQKKSNVNINFIF